MGNYASKVIAIAKAELGYLEKKSNSNLDHKTANAGYNNFTKYARDLDALGDFYNGKKQGYAYCDMFVDWCFLQAYGLKKALELLCQPKRSYGAGCSMSAAYYKGKGQFYTKDPKIGDQIFFWDSSKRSIAHTGIVYNVDKTYVYTIEGNTSGASGVIANGGGVCKKKYLLSYGRIHGYGRPKYDPEPVDTKIDTVKEVQQWLNKTYGSGLSVDNDYGSKTKKALVKALQKELGVKVDGDYGPITSNAIKKNNLLKGDKGPLVKVLQALLVCNGYASAYVDGSYGNGTVSAVKSYQKKKGLTADGIAGSGTFSALCK